MYFGPQIIIYSGISIDGYEEGEMGILLNIPLAVTNAIGSTIAIFIIDKLGRRYIMLRSLPFIFFTLCMVSLSMYLSLYGRDPDTV